MSNKTKSFVYHKLYDKSYENIPPASEEEKMKHREDDEEKEEEVKKLEDVTSKEKFLNYPTNPHTPPHNSQILNLKNKTRMNEKSRRRK